MGFAFILLAGGQRGEGIIFLPVLIVAIALIGLLPPPHISDPKGRIAIGVVIAVGIVMLLAAVASHLVIEGLIVTAIFLTLALVIVCWYFTLASEDRVRARTWMTILAGLVCVSILFFPPGVRIANTTLVSYVEVPSVQVVVMPIYLFGCGVVSFLDFVLSLFTEEPILHFWHGGAGDVRPDAVFAVWFAITALLGLSLLSDYLERRRVERRTTTSEAGDPWQDEA
ncbi:MAG: hypothetical protein DWQ37_21550 [Planctomycetota bacterium]|nr:MAG: hypothetical protein DWQ37_21550 [Planctomycetota bacterium]